MNEPRDVIRSCVRERAMHNSVERVKDTCSFARAEKLLGKEYHGRFLIELLQNAADAWRLTDSGDPRCEVKVVIDRDGPALVVANHGADFSAEVILDSLGQIGSSTKTPGKAIGHKGIGFKSVLEVTGSPEVYSNLHGGVPGVAVRFDAAAALRLIEAASDKWQEGLEAVKDLKGTDAIPVLRFPTWVDKPRPKIVEELADEGFATIIRLPYTGAPSELEDWLDALRRAVDELSDQILLLLGTFDRLTVLDRLAGTNATIQPQWSGTTGLPDAVHYDRVEVLRGQGTVSSAWHLFRRDIPGESGLSGEVVVGVRCEAASGTGPRPVVQPDPEAVAAPFHLFFPTRISSGLPFLLHGYFEVNAARTGFYEGSAAHNRAILAEMSRLTVIAVRALAESGDVDMASLVNLIAQSGEPDEAAAQEFRQAVLDALDVCEWIPRADGGLAKPADMLITQDERLDQHLAETFPADYIRRVTGLELPSTALTRAACDFVRSRRSEPIPLWETLERLLRPGKDSPWAPGSERTGFRALLDLVTAIQGIDPKRAEGLFERLRGAEDAALIPVVASGGALSVLPLPDPESGAKGRRSTLVMGRVRGSESAPLTPPPALDVAFLPDGLLGSEAEIGRARPLGVRPFTVDPVLDRLNALEGTAGDEGVVAFLWHLLSRARTSEFGTINGARQLSVFAPGRWFWCRPDRADASVGERERQRRERLLAAVQLPALDGTWRPAGSLAFGADWAAWVKSALQPLDSAAQARVSSYQDLEDAAPGPGSLLARPKTVLAILADPGSQDADATDAADELGEDVGPTLEQQRLAFLLRLGVWEVVPVQGYQSLQPEPSGRPWAEERERLEPGLDARPWNFDAHRWGGKYHTNAWVSEDYRLAWPLTTGDREQRRALHRALAVGAPLYSALAGASGRCRACGSHINTYRTGPEERRPSTLRLQLRHEPWLSTTLAGKPSRDGIAPTAAWYAEKPPSAAGMATSPLQFLALVDAGVAESAQFRALLGITDIAHASPARLEELLRSLAERVKSPANSQHATTGSQQALVGLHRLVYERLAETPAAASDVASRVGVLCQRNGILEYCAPRDARYDTGRHSTYKRHFAPSVPFVVLAREKVPIADALGVRPFEVTVARRGTDAGRDVTEALADVLTHRIPELLAILVHHSLGSQTLEQASDDFERRSRRLRALRVLQLDDLVLDVSTDAVPGVVTLGKGSSEDTFLDGPTTNAPALFHDLHGDDWVLRIRPRLAVHLASLVENPAYAATFQLLLTADSEYARENVLQDLAITQADIDDIKRSLGALTDQDRRTSQRWFAALIAAKTGSPPQPDNLDPHPSALTEALQRAGFGEKDAHLLADAGGPESARSQDSGVPDLVESSGIELSELDRLLRQLEGSGLTITAAPRMLSDWRQRHGRQVAAVLAGATAEAEAKAAPAGWHPRQELAFELRPNLVDVLTPVVDSLRRYEFDPSPQALADDPVTELVRLAGVPDAASLDRLVVELYDEEERRRQQGARARQWIDALIEVFVLARSAPGETNSAIRGNAKRIRDGAPIAPPAPSALANWVQVELHLTPGLADALAAMLDDAFTSPPPDRQRITDAAVEHGLDAGLARRIRAVLTAPPRERALELRRLGKRLADKGVSPALPAGMAAPPERTPPPKLHGPRDVKAVKVDPASDRRKREIGAEAETAALAAVLDPLLAMPPKERAAAIGELAAFLQEHWGEEAVRRLLAHRDDALSDDLDEEDVAHHLAAFLHVSQISDAFGFDMLGWLATDASSQPRPIALEVKGSSDTGFLMSRGEWGEAQRLRDRGDGGGFAILVVRRRRSGDLPEAMDLLIDPVTLLEAGSIKRVEDGYRVDYALIPAVGEPATSVLTASRAMQNRTGDGPGSPAPGRGPAQGAW